MRPTRREATTDACRIDHLQNAIGRVLDGASLEFAIASPWTYSFLSRIDRPRRPSISEWAG
jgi:phosphopantetheine adenylyltransferase